MNKKFTGSEPAYDILTNDFMETGMELIKSLKDKPGSSAVDYLLPALTPLFIAHKSCTAEQRKMLNSSILAALMIAYGVMTKEVEKML